MAFLVLEGRADYATVRLLDGRSFRNLTGIVGTVWVVDRGTSWRVYRTRQEADADASGGNVHTVGGSEPAPAPSGVKLTNTLGLPTGKTVAVGAAAAVAVAAVAVVAWRA